MLQKRLNLKCEAVYIPSFLTEEESKELYDELLHYKELISPFTMTMFNGEEYHENYGKMMFMDENLFTEQKFPKHIWGSSKVWTNSMMLIKEGVETYAQFSFHTCVCIYYPDGNAGVDYHSDYAAFGDTSVIASISLGQERAFHLREKATQKITEIQLQNGSMVLMGKGCQELYEHALPINPKYKEPRINLTFRKYGYKD